MAVEAYLKPLAYSARRDGTVSRIGCFESRRFWGRSHPTISAMHHGCARVNRSERWVDEGRATDEMARHDGIGSHGTRRRWLFGGILRWHIPTDVSKSERSADCRCYENPRSESTGGSSCTVVIVFGRIRALGRVSTRFSTHRKNALSHHGAVICTTL